MDARAMQTMPGLVGTGEGGVFGCIRGQAGASSVPYMLMGKRESPNNNTACLSPQGGKQEHGLGRQTISQ